MLEQSCEDPNDTQVGDTANRFLKCYFMMKEGRFPLCHQPNSTPWSIWSSDPGPPLEVEPLLQNRWESRFSTPESMGQKSLLGPQKPVEERLEQLKSSLLGLQSCLVGVCLHFQVSHTMCAVPAAPTADCLAPWVMWWPVGTFHWATPFRAAYQFSSVIPTTL